MTFVLLGSAVMTFLLLGLLDCTGERYLLVQL